MNKQTFTRVCIQAAIAYLAIVSVFGYPKKLEQPELIDPLTNLVILYLAGKEK